MDTKRNTSLFGFLVGALILMFGILIAAYGFGLSFTDALSVAIGVTFAITGILVMDRELD